MSRHGCGQRRRARAEHPKDFEGVRILNRYHAWDERNPSDEEEAELVLESGALVIGVNNRYLRDFTVDLGTVERLAPRLAGATLLAESGVKNFSTQPNMS
jgi:hypothetical protein